MKDQFISLYNESIHRPGADKLLAWLQGSDFFTAPASTRFHLARPGGLVEHSIHVYQRLCSLYEAEYSTPDETYLPQPEEMETLAIVGLLHDVCKVNFYGVEMRNRKNAEGRWEQYPFYVVNDQLPYGHGEKSVYIVSGFMKLSREEAMAIRWHMGLGDVDRMGGAYSLGKAFEKFPLALMAHIADLQATYIDEAEDKEKRA